ncbi:protein apterous [Cylas formicarius]|uniref:protein apterous n=1 Tax=Cylas formicarius TaxID=197179 RepID=UPI0029589C00|nr:protein apterous [Cylas formicarius]
MGVFEEAASHTPGMHWQQNEQYIGPAYDPSRDLSPNLPSCDSSSMGDPSAATGIPGDPSITSSGGGSGRGSACSTPSNNNHQSCGSDICRPPPNHPACANDSCRTLSNHSSGNAEPCRSVVPFGRPARSVTPAELRRPQSSFEHHIPKIEPEQPPSNPPTPPSSCADDSAVGVVVCAGCGTRITDRYYLQAVERRWHATCLQCCQCRNSLDGDITCFSRDGNIYCKKDYYRLFGMKRCARCQATILASELVMRAKDLVFHVHCFSCEVCNAPLTKGDHFGMRAGSVLCRLHFEMPPIEIPPSGMFGFHHPYAPSFPSPDFHSTMPPQAAPPPPSEPPVGKVSFFNGAPGSTPRQKGRPRKRKPKDLEGMTANLDLNQEYLDIPFGRSPGTPGLHGSNQRTKRMRTSFKHHQLRTMKSYFAINHNPDAKDLKQLSQKTGLPKRVLQVWFQNARAKWRRMMLKQEGKTGEKCSGSDAMSDIDMYSHGGPGSIGSSISMQAHSPPFILPPGSPSSLDCS